MAEKSLITERLLLRPLELNDEVGIVQMQQNGNVLKHINGGIPRSYDEAINDLNRWVNRWDGQFGVWAVLDRQNNDFLGWAALQRLDNSDEIEVGYRFLESTWGKGYATEAGNILVKYGFEELDVPEIVGIAHPDNKASIRVLEKLGLKFVKYAHFYNTDVVYLALGRETYIESKKI